MIKMWKKKKGDDLILNPIFCFENNLQAQKQSKFEREKSMIILCGDYGQHPGTPQSHWKADPFTQEHEHFL